MNRTTTAFCSCLSTSLMFIFLKLTPFCLFAQSGTPAPPGPDTEFKLLTVKDALPYNTILSIISDRQGFIWIATPEGLCRYDGTSFVTYKHNPNDSTTVMSNHINHLADDSQGRIWGTTSDGLFCLDTEKGVFTNYYPRPNDPSAISCDNLGRVFIDSKDNVYVGSWTDYNVYNPLTKKFRQYFHNKRVSSSIRENKVGYTYEDRKGRIWVGTYSGLDLLDPQSNTFEHIKLPSLFEQFGSGPLINDMYADNNGNLWLSTWASGLIRYNHDKKEAEIYRIEKDRPANGSTNVVTSILHTDYPGEENKLWIGTKSSGLYLFDMEKETFEHFNQTQLGHPSFITYDVNTLYDDGAGNILVGTGDGLLVFNRFNQKFSTVALNLDPVKCLADIFCIYQDPADSTGNTLWIGTWTCGGYKYDMSTASLQHQAISFSADILIDYSAVHEFYRDRSGNLWAFCRDGTYLQKQNTTKWLRLPADNGDEQKLWIATISSFTEEKDGTFWFGCRNGLMHYDPSTGIVKRVRLTANDGTEIAFKGLDFVEFPENIFWIIGAPGQIIRFDITDQGTTIFSHTYDNKESLPVAYDIREIFLDSRNTIWLGTKHGLISFNPLDKQPVYKSYHTTDGLPSEIIYSISEDKESRIWSSTQNGISRFDPKTSQFRNYGIANGLINPDLNGAMSISSTGKLFIGHSNLFQYFDPAQLGNSNYCGPVRVTGIRVLGKDYAGGKTPSYTDSINLSYKQNEVTISFAMINYTAGDQTDYDYFLEGLNDDWIPIGKNHSVTFTNLDGGTYNLHVRGYNADGVCGEGEKLLTLIVTPPFWKTPWFFLTLAVLIVAGMFTYVRLRLRNLRRIKKELQAMVARRTEQLEIAKDRAEKSEKFKQQFLANMSHEIRTPMNAVIGMTNLLIDKSPRSDQDYYLQAVKRSSETLLHIINDILDLSKIEAGKIELEYIDFSVKEVLNDVMAVLKYKADEKSIRLHLEIDEIPVLLGDPVRLYQVLMNLAGNAIKFTEKGSVQIVAGLANQGKDAITVKFSVTDTGIGIPKEKLNVIFESFTQAQASDTRKYGGTGLGLSISKQLIELLGGTIQIESEEGKGTTFSFQLQFQRGASDKLMHGVGIENAIDGSILDGLKILVADDNEYNRIVASDTLKLNADVSVQQASTGTEVIQLLKQFEFDIILMDVQMPEMNGFEATRYIRNNFESPKKDIPIIALTASVLHQDLYECTKSGMNGYIPKPFTASQLVTGIAQVLGIEVRTVPKKKVIIPDENPNEGITNLNYLHNFCEGDASRMNRYISVFLETAPVLMERIRAAADENNLTDIADQVHSYKTTWVMMGMTRSKELAAIIERQCREQNGHNTTESVLLLLKHLEKAIAELQQYQK